MATQNYDNFVNNQTFEATQAAPSGLINAAAAQGTASLQAPASTYTGAQATAANWAVQPNQTVQSQVKGIIDDNSPLMQQAETRALQKYNARGLVNSSMAVGAGQAALYDAAMPMATQDAATYARAGEFNAGAQQQTGLANQGSTNTASQFNAGAQNQTNSQNSQLQTNVSLNNAASANDMRKFQGSLNADLAKFNASESNALKKLGMDAQTKTELANIEANYKMLMQSSSSASDLYKQMVLNASNIMSSKDMDAAAKTAAMNNQMALLNSGLGMIGKIGNLNLSDLLTFDSAPGAGPGAGAVPAAGAAPTSITTQQAVQPGAIPITGANWNEQAYLAANPDVAAAVANGQIPSGMYHFQKFGSDENRQLGFIPATYSDYGGDGDQGGDGSDGTGGASSAGDSSGDSGGTSV